MKKFMDYLFLIVFTTFVHQLKAHPTYLILRSQTNKSEPYIHNNPFIAKLFDNHINHSHTNFSKQNFNRNQNSGKDEIVHVSFYDPNYSWHPEGNYVVLNRANSKDAADLRTRCSSPNSNCKRLYASINIAVQNQTNLTTTTTTTPLPPDLLYYDPTIGFENDNPDYEPLRLLRRLDKVLNIMESKGYKKSIIKEIKAKAAELMRDKKEAQKNDIINLKISINGALNNRIGKPTLRDSANRKFSEDYLDFQEYIRATDESKNSDSKISRLTAKAQNKLLQEAVKIVTNYLETIKKKTDLKQISELNARKAAEENASELTERSKDSDESSDEESSEEEQKVPKRVANKKKKPKRFQVIDSLNEEYKEEKSKESAPKSSESNEEYEALSEEIPKKPTPSKLRIPGKPDIIMQAPGRMYKEGKDFRKRVWDWFDARRRDRNKMFLPKRYFWNEEDYKKLGTFWFNGPQGRDPGPWRLVW